MTDTTELRRLRAIVPQQNWEINPPGMYWDRGMTYCVPVIGMNDANYYPCAPEKDVAEYIVALHNAAPALLNAADELARVKAVMASVTAAESMGDAIDADLARQAALQSGCTYERADECGLSSADMDIVTHEAATAALAALRELIGGV